MKKYFFLMVMIIFCATKSTTAQSINNESRYIVTLETTCGDIKLILLNSTDKHRDNFVKNIKDKIYNGVKFHRIIRDFMIQTGDHNTKYDSYLPAKYGSSSNGTNIYPEFADNAIHTVGAVAMGRESDSINPERLSSGSQFYIITGGNKLTASMLGKQEEKTKNIYSNSQRSNYLSNGGAPHLDYEYVVFGGIVEGMPVVKLISESSTDKAGLPREFITIKKAKCKKISLKALKKKYNYNEN